MAGTVRDDTTELAEGDIRLYVDGRNQSAFFYSSATDRLRYVNDRLPAGRHTVRIVATDAAGNTGDETWNFRIQSG
ncbi:MAG: hypothetical protein M3151_06625 [Actinomycetota bacterium]|nr:hypothetical protein [Actinomycetota bacterium]